MVAVVRPDYPSEYAAMIAVAGTLSIGSPETIRTWIHRHQVDGGDRPSVATDSAEKIKMLTREKTPGRFKLSGHTGVTQR